MPPPTPETLSIPVLIVGGGTGGVAAAWACASMGVRCLIVEPTDWLGGQFTSQAVPPDENRWVEDVDSAGQPIGCTRRYRALRERVRAAFRAHPDADPSNPRLHSPVLNPGGGWVSRLCASPAAWHGVMRDELAASNGKIGLLLCHDLISVDTSGDRVTAVTVRDASPGGSGRVTTICAQLVLDATETGEVLALGAIEHALGAEHRDVFGELHGRTDFPPSRRLDPLDQQACSWCFALEHRPGEDHTIPKPSSYPWWREHVPAMSPAWCGPLFSWRVPSHQPPGCREFRFVPWPDEPKAGEWEMWRYRRIVDRSLFRPETGAAHPDVALINMVQMDYWQKPLLGTGDAERSAALAGAREQSLCFLYWMQTEAPRHDSSSATGYPGLRLRGDELGTTDGLAKAVYVREPRRLTARTIVTEAHIGTEQRRAEGHATDAHNWSATPYGTAYRFADSVGVGHYMIDLHPSCAGRNNVYVPAAPFRIPMGALVPVRCRNLLVAGKAIGVTHITNGCYRMHHVEWNVGESAGLLAACCVLGCLGRATEPHAVHESAERVREFQSLLAAQGVPVKWPWESLA